MEESLFRRIVENSHDVAYAYDAEGLITYLSPQIRRFGMEPDALIGKSILEVVLPEDRELVLADLKRTVDTGAEFPTEFRIQDSEGGIHWMEEQGTVFRDDEGNITAVAGAVREITSRKKLEEQLAAALAVLDKKVRTRTADLKKSETLREEEAERYRQLFQHCHDAIIMHDLEGGIIEVNDRVLEHFGYTREEIVELNIADLHPPDQAAASKRAFAEISRAGAVSFEAVFLRKDGTTFHGDVTASRFEVKGQHLVQGVVRDVTARRAAEEAYRESRAQLLAVIESMPFDVFALGPDGRYFLQNSSARKRWGDTIGKRPEDVDVSADILSIWQRHIQEALAGEKVHEELPVNVRGEEKVFYSGLSPIEVNGRVEGVIGVNIDVTDRYMAQRERAGLDRKLRRAQKMEVVAELAGGIAHDFNNVLTAIQGSAELLGLDAKPGSEQAELTGQIMEASRRAANLTRQLLAFARRGQVRRADVDIHEVIKEVQGMVGHRLGRAIDIQLHLDAPRSQLTADRAQLETSLLNLTLNAREAMPTGGTLTFETRNRSIADEPSGTGDPELLPGEYIEIRVQDTGIGMSNDVREHVFEPFFTTKTTALGSGLSLASVFGCVKSHGGTIDVDSREGQGTTFTIMLPLAHEANESRADNAAAPAGRGEHILIVDDEEIVRNFAARALTQLGYKISTCADGEEAIDVYRRHAGEIDLVILDLIMPSLTAETVFRHLHEIDPDVKVLLCSGFSRTEAADRLIEAGALGFLDKPFEIEQIARQLRECLD